MSKSQLYENFHKYSSVVKKVIVNNNFTYFNLLFILKKYFKNQLNEKTTVLDLGCGTGTISFYLAQKGFNVLGVGVSRKAIQLANKGTGELGFKNKVRFIRKDILKLNLGEKKLFAFKTNFKKKSAIAYIFPGFRKPNNFVILAKKV